MIKSALPKKLNNMWFAGLIFSALIILWMTHCRNKPRAEINHKENKDITDYGFILKDGKLWFHDHAMNDVDPQSFTVLDEYYARDSTQLLFYQSYRESKNYYLTTKNVVEVIKSIDPNSFSPLGEGYGQDKVSAYFEGKSFVVKHPSSLTVINRHFVKDKLAAYLDRSEIMGSDGSTFELVGSVYAKDRHHVYYYLFSSNGPGEISILSDFPSQFAVLEHPFAKDEKNVYYFGDKIQTCNPTMFKPLGFGYSRDDKNVFFQAFLVNACDLSSFTVFQENENFTGEGAYGKDKHSVFYKQTAISNADVNSFAILNEHYARDHQSVYFQGRPIRAADVQTFETFPHDMGDADAKDKNHRYHQGRKVEE